MPSKTKKPKNRNPIARVVKAIRPQVKPNKKKDNPEITYNTKPIFSEE